MFSIWRRLWDLPPWMRALMAGQVVSSAGGVAWVYLSLYLVADRGLTPAAAGVVAAAYGTGLIAGNVAGGWFGDRFGLRRGLLASRFGWVVLCLAIPVTPAAVLAPLVCAAGLCSGAGRPLGFALVADALPADRRREGMALSRTAANLGFTVGPPLGALLAAYDFGLIFVLDAATTAVLAVIVWRAVPRDHPAVQAHAAPAVSDHAAPAVSDHAAPAVGDHAAPTVGDHVVPGAAIRRRSVSASLRADPAVVAILLTVVVVDTVYRQLLTPLPLLLRDQGHSALAYGILMAANSVIIVLFEAPIAVRLRHRSALGVVSAGYALVGAGCLVLGVAPGLPAAAVAVAVITAGEMLYKPTATAYVADAAPPGMVARYQSLYGASSIAGTVLAPALGGLGYEHAPRLLWPVAGLLALTAALALRAPRLGDLSGGWAATGCGFRRRSQC